jgi:phosphatidate cytidylyltransferase
MKFDPQLLWLTGGIVGLLVLSSAITFFLKRKAAGKPNAVVANLDARVKAWWAMVAIFGLALAIGLIGSVILFGFISFFALREFVTLTPTRPGDHRTLFWAFFIVTPLQYYLVGMEWYGLFAILIPVYAFILVPTRSALAGDSEHFLERTSKIQWALMVCVYCVSHVPALLTLHIPGYEGQNAKLMMFFVLVVQISDVLQYVWGKLLGKHKIAPQISPNKTVEGFWGGMLSATAIGTALWWATPFNWWQAGALSFLITLMGFFGGLVMSAIKRDRGVKDYGTLIEGHGGVMDRIDSLCFAAPVFFHLVRYFFT